MGTDILCFLFPFLMGRLGTVGKHVRYSDSLQDSKCDRAFFSFFFFFFFVFFFFFFFFFFFVSKKTVGLSNRFVHTVINYSN